ncbi:hypothetical protein LAWI1_G004456 [Lachnellula willkommii]|uniref:RNase H type-1 domain-containing protein n=1 Tax=Lachnellula willkommii TaxID=215461 RepID=A0A559M4V6_9HELO|nr:hypothetical protein LAWI1_G004456 [Lachnellula willkommii]
MSLMPRQLERFGGCRERLNSPPGVGNSATSSISIALWLFGHIGIPGNKEADWLADKGAKEPCNIGLVGEPTISGIRLIF